MEVILREDVAHLGSIGDVVRVKPGFARNYLIPRGLAVLADVRNRRALEHQKRVIDERRQRALKAAETLGQKLAALEIVIPARAGAEGKLFGSVTNLDVERALASQGIQVERRKIRLAEPIKQVGEHRVPIHLGVGVDAEVTVRVKAEGVPEGEPPEEAEAAAAVEEPGAE